VFYELFSWLRKTDKVTGNVVSKK